MKRSLAVALLVLGALTPANAQVAPPNRSGVAMGHVHYIVRDVAATIRFWVALGGVLVKAGGADAISFPGMLVLLTPGMPSGGSVDSVVDHVAFRVQSLDKAMAAVTAAGFKAERTANLPLTGRAYSPDGAKIELFDITSDSPKFAPDPGPRDSDFERHEGPMAQPVVTQHIHYYIPAGGENEMKAWYLKMFGGTPGTRLRYHAIDLPGMNLNFSVSPTPSASLPTKGRTNDHLGFEVRDLAAFCRKLEAAGVKFDTPYAKRDGIATAMLTDPWGARIELTEGLRP